MFSIHRSTEATSFEIKKINLFSKPEKPQSASYPLNNFKVNTPHTPLPTSPHFLASFSAPAPSAPQTPSIPTSSSPPVPPATPSTPLVADTATCQKLTAARTGGWICPPSQPPGRRAGWENCLFPAWHWRFWAQRLRRSATIRWVSTLVFASLECGVCSGALGWFRWQIGLVSQGFWGRGWWGRWWGVAGNLGGWGVSGRFRRRSRDWGCRNRITGGD